MTRYTYMMIWLPATGNHVKETLQSSYQKPSFRSLEVQPTWRRCQHSQRKEERTHLFKPQAHCETGVYKKKANAHIHTLVTIFIYSLHLPSCAAWSPVIVQFSDAPCSTYKHPWTWDTTDPVPMWWNCTNTSSRPFLWIGGSATVTASANKGYSPQQGRANGLQVCRAQMSRILHHVSKETRTVTLLFMW